MVLFLRSLSCQVMFYLVFLLYGLMIPVVLIAHHRFAWHWATLWMRAVIFWWRVTTRSTIEFRGMENLPEGGYIIASKHQSAWETIGFAHAIYDLVYIMKKELMYIPIFGWFCAKARMIPINRKDGARAIAPMIKAAKQAVDEGRKLVIFMEGTRVPAGTKKRYKSGVVRIAEELQCPIVPVALNTGLFWPRNGFWRYSGHLVVEFLPPLMADGDSHEVMKKLENIVEESTNALLLETARSDNPPPTIGPALEALQERGIDIKSVC